METLPGEHSQGSQVDPVYTIQQQQLALNGCSDQWRWPPRCVSVWESVPLLEKVPGCHVLEMKWGGVPIITQWEWMKQAKIFFHAHSKYECQHD